MNGICKGGPWDGKQYLSERDYIHADWPLPEPIYASVGRVQNIKIKTHTYTKQWLVTNGTKLYRWV